MSWQFCLQHPHLLPRTCLGLVSRHTTVPAVKPTRTAVCRHDGATNSSSKRLSVLSPLVPRKVRTRTRSSGCRPPWASDPCKPVCDGQPASQLPPSKNVRCATSRQHTQLTALGYRVLRRPYRGPAWRIRHGTPRYERRQGPGHHILCMAHVGGHDVLCIRMYTATYW
jgi:hypothetical protein